MSYSPTDKWPWEFV